MSCSPAALRWSLLADVAEIPEHVIVAGGGVVAPGPGLLDAHGPSSDVDAAAHALAVGRPVTAVAAEGLIASDARLLEGHGAGIVVEPAAEGVAAVAAHGAAGPDGEVVIDLAMADGEGSKERRVAIGHAAANGMARVAPVAAGAANGPVPAQPAMVHAE